MGMRLKDAKTRKQIINGCYIGLAGNHEGRDRTIAKIAQKYFWPGLSKDVRIWVQHCDQCQKTKRKFDHPAKELHPVPVPNRSWKQIGIDLIGPLPTTANVVDDNIVDEVEELDNSDMEWAGEQEAANGKNAELDLQQEEYALSKDIDVSLWIDFQYEEQCSSSSSISSRVLEITKEEHNDHINYQPVCSEWQKERCALLGLTFITTARIAADGNCFFGSVSLAVTGSLEFHEELRLLITTYMIHKSTDPMLSSLGSPVGSV
eukprot:Em0017g241a